MPAISNAGARLDLQCWRGTTLGPLQFDFDDGAGGPDFTGATIAASVYVPGRPALIAALDCALIGDSTIEVTIPDAVSAAFKSARAEWALRIEQDGVSEVPVQGVIEFLGQP